MSSERRKGPSPREGDDEERNGIQWQTAGPGLAIFAASAVLSFVLGDATLEFGDRAVAALLNATTMLLVTIVGIGLLSRFFHHTRLSSRTLFVVVWGVVALLWLATWAASRK